eukprot:1141689-Pelagomonas_calceolata.AAC.6
MPGGGGLEGPRGLCGGHAPAGGLPLHHGMYGRPRHGAQAWGMPTHGMNGRPRHEAQAWGMPTVGSLACRVVFWYQGPGTL